MEIVLESLANWIRRTVPNRGVRWLLLGLLFALGVAVAYMEWVNYLS